MVLISDFFEFSKLLVASPGFNAIIGGLIAMLSSLFLKKYELKLRFNENKQARFFNSESFRYYNEFYSKKIVELSFKINSPHINSIITDFIGLLGDLLVYNNIFKIRDLLSINGTSKLLHLVNTYQKGYILRLYKYPILYENFLVRYFIKKKIIIKVDLTQTTAYSDIEVAVIRKFGKKVEDYFSIISAVI